MITSIIYANMLPFIALVALLLMAQHNRLFQKKQARLFRVAIIINLAALIAISADGLLQDYSFSSAWIFRRFTSFINFAASPLIPLLLYQIFSEKMAKEDMHVLKEEDEKSKTIAGKKRFILLYAPAVLNFILCALSMFYKLVFEVSIENTYDRGPLFIIPFSVSVIYLLVLMIGVGKYGHKGIGSERIYLLCTVGALVFCMYMEIGQAFRFLTWDCASVSIILYYLLINVNRSNLDSLTGVFNHAMYMKELSEVERRIPCTIAMMDINDFKNINDTQGHDAGDRFLIHFASILQDETEKGTAVYRVGGDEFTVISRKWNKKGMEDHLKQAKEKANQAHFDFAFGIVEYEPGEILESVLKQADAKMYQDKNEYKLKKSQM